jgi:hypothetical protein
MDRFLLIGAVLLPLAVLGACSKSPQTSPQAQAEPAGPHIATLCIARSRWPELIDRMRRFGREHSLSFHGEMTEAPTGQPPVFNYYLAAGYNYYLDDDLDLWLVSDPFREGNVGFGAVPRRKPVTADQMKLALDLLSAIRDLSTKTVVGDITPSTPEVRC